MVNSSDGSRASFSSCVVTPAPMETAKFEEAGALTMLAVEGSDEKSTDLTPEMVG
jgi:hypothetical protein